MKIGLYFGSFNPIHHGHLLIASYILQHTELKQVWFVVSPQNPFKPTASLLIEYHRFYLVQLAIEGENNFKVSVIEFKLPKPYFTLVPLPYLQEKYPPNHFALHSPHNTSLNHPTSQSYTS